MLRGRHRKVGGRAMNKVGKTRWGRPAAGWLTLALGLATALTGEAGETRKGDQTVRKQAEITVGHDSGDIRGSDHRALQAAVDYVANLGGGVVRIRAGTYTLRNALFLRDGVTVIGEEGTVLVAGAGAESRLVLDGDCNERQVTVAEPSLFRIGDGISVQDSRMGGGFGVTTATIQAQVGPNSFAISRPLYYDYMVAKNATVRLVFPLVAGYQVKDAAVEGLTLEGNRSKTRHLNGCRGGGIYLFECARIQIRNCTVRNYNGDGISFQVSTDVTVEDCRAEGNAGLGIHPGSGSSRPILRRNRSIGNDGDGIYVCWRVKHGLFEDNLVQGNGGRGISIGHKDTDNVFRRNRIVGNARSGILFRNESEPMGAHRNLFEENVILDNGSRGDGAAPVRILGHTRDLIFRNNRIGYTESSGGPAFRVGAHVEGLQLEGNTLVNVRAEQEAEEK